MAQQNVVTACLQIANNDPHLQRGQIFRQPPPPFFPQAQYTRDQSVIEAHRLLQDTMVTPASLPYFNQTTFLKAVNIFNTDYQNHGLATCFENADQAKGFARHLCELDVDNFEIDPQFQYLSAEQKRIAVAVLVQACMATGNAEDTPRSKNAFGSKACDLRLVEIRCWTMLKVSIMRMNNSQPLLRPLSNSSGTAIAFVDMSLGGRFDGLVELLSTSKFRTGQVLGPSALLELVDNPSHAKTRTATNRGGAAEKQRRIERGKAAERGGLVQGTQGHDLEEPNESDDRSEVDLNEDGEPVQAVVSQKRRRTDRYEPVMRELPEPQARAEMTTGDLETGPRLPASAFTTHGLFHSLPAPESVIGNGLPVSSAPPTWSQTMPLPPSQYQQNSFNQTQPFHNNMLTQQAPFANLQRFPVETASGPAMMANIARGNTRAAHQFPNRRQAASNVLRFPRQNTYQVNPSHNVQQPTNLPLLNSTNTRFPYINQPYRPVLTAQLPTAFPGSNDVMPSVEVPPTTAAVPDPASHLVIAMHDGTHMHVPINPIDTPGSESSEEPRTMQNI